MNEQVRKIIQDNPKHYVTIIKHNKLLWDWVTQNSTTQHTSNAAKIYSALSGESGICVNGQQKRFIGIFDGFGFCGRTASCQCAKQSVSNKVSIAKQNRTNKQIESENIKRNKTTLLRYGVKNNGQTQTAIDNHRKFYDNKKNVTAVVKQVKDTKLDRYGDENYNNRTKAIESCTQKYGVSNTWLLSDDNQNPNLIKLREKEQLMELYPRFTIEEIANLLNVHPQTVYHYTHLHGLREPYKSTFEQEIVIFLNKHGIQNILCNKRNIIKSEIDIYLPDYNLAIEYNGVYWHHDQIPHITKTYHYDKFIQCEQKGITLLTIFGNSWAEKKEIWEQKILSMIGHAERKVYARNTKVVSLSAIDTKKFLNNFHVQGYCSSQHCYGLEHQGEIVAVMTFSNSRAGIGKNRGTNSYELVRYATACSVTGGASKLLKKFIKDHSPRIIFSYSDNQYSVGKLYKLLGFTQESENKCGYWYYDPNKKQAYHRFNFTKSKLVKQGFDPNKTEKQIMRERGFFRIWDCGSRTWVLNIKGENNE